jgi:Flp pilus assembly protein TadG
VTALRRRLQAAVRTQRGQTLVEFALVSPLFLMLSMGIIEFAFVGQAWATVQHASLEGARYASTGQVDCPGLTGDRLNCIKAVTKTATEGIPGAGSGSALVTVTVESWQYPTYANPSVANDPGGACDAVQIVVSYTHNIMMPLLTFVAPSGITLVGKKRTLVEPINTCGA